MGKGTLLWDMNHWSPCGLRQRLQPAWKVWGLGTGGQLVLQPQCCVPGELVLVEGSPPLGNLHFATQYRACVRALPDHGFEMGWCPLALGFEYLEWDALSLNVWKELGGFGHGKSGCLLPSLERSNRFLDLDLLWSQLKSKKEWICLCVYWISNHSSTHNSSQWMLMQHKTCLKKTVKNTV